VEESEAPIKVPRKSWGNTKMNASPVAALDVLAIVAVIRPKPTLDREKTNTIVKANMYAEKSMFGLNPIR